MKVTLLSTTKNMFTSVAMVWECSRTVEPITQLRRAEEDRILFFKLLDEGVPLMDMVEVLFLLEDIPISLREQLVRHRLGIKHDDKVGIDIIPDVMDSAFWVQSMRVINMGAFATKGQYYIPESIRENKEGLEHYLEVLHQIQYAYNNLVNCGIPKEDARQVIPLGATHRMAWKLSMTAAKHICSKRSCWIAQLGMWKEIIQGMISELASIDTRFHDMVSPPCIINGEFTGCKFCIHNEKRVHGIEGEQMPPCPLYLHQVQGSASINQHLRTSDMWQYASGHWICKEPSGRTLMTRMKLEYETLWNRNTNTGENLNSCP